MKKNNFSQVLAITSLLIGILLFTTCELFSPGLGDKVDIEVPVVGIESHRNGDYVGGVVTLTGYASDDAGISTVAATYDDLIIEAELAGEQWSLDFDTNAYPDGDYEITFTATDSSDKIASFNLLLVVDNSPPSVLVTSPTEYGPSNDFNKFISIKGEAADTTRVDQVFISLYRLDGTPVFEDEVATGSSSWYYIFDASDEITYIDGNYYFDVRAVDPSGNSSSYFYHFNDLMGIAVDPGKTPNVEEINAAEFQGIPIPPTVIAPPDSLSDIRKSTTDDSGTPVDERMVINIDPDSDNPQISIISPSEASVDPADNVFSSPVSLYGTVQDDDLAGINKDTLTITIFALDDVSETGLFGTPVTYDTLVPNPNFTLNGNQWTFSTSIDDGEYRVKLVVSDLSSPPSEGTSNSVPFTVSSFAPTISMTEPTQGSFVGDGSTITVTADISGLGGSSDVWLDWDGDGLYEKEMTETLPAVPPAPATWSVTLIEGTTPGDGDYSAETFEIITDGDFTVKVRAGSPGNYGNGTLRLVGDTSTPAGSFDEPLESAQVNGLLTIRGVADDTEKDTKKGYLETVYFHVGPSPSSPVFPGDYADLVQTYNWNTTFDTTAVADGSYTATIIVEDAAGNFSAPVSRNFEVLQASDNPVIEYTNIDSANDTLAESGNNLLETNAKILGNLKDDDSFDVSTFNVTIYNSDDTIRTVTGPVSDPPSSNGTLSAWEHDISSLPEGVYYAVFSVYDTNDPDPIYTVTDRVYFTIDLSPTVLNIDFPDAGSFQSKPFNIEGDASDGNGLIFGDHDGDSSAVTPDTDYLEVFNGISWINEPVAPDGTWSHTVTAPVDHSNDGPKSYQVRATDLFGKTTTKTLDFIIDTIYPTLTVTNPAVDLWTSVNTLSVNGNSADANGVVSIEVSLNDSDWEIVNGTTTWNQLLDISGLTEGENRVVYFRSTDVAGNVTSVTRNINIVRNAPAFTEKSYDSSVPVYETGDYSLTGLLVDTPVYSLWTFDDDSDGGAVTAEVPYIDIRITPGSEIKVPIDGDGSWTYPVAFADGRFDYELSITDKAGNISNIINRTVIADNAPPSLDSISSPAADSLISGSAYSISGTASDTGEAGLETLYWWVGVRGDSAPDRIFPYTGWTAADGLGNWSDSLDLIDIGEGDKTLHAFAVDKAGIVSGESTVDFTIDQAAPVIIEDGLGGTNITSNGDISLELTITETNGIVSGDLLDGGAAEDVTYFELMLNGTDWAADALRIEYTGPDMTHTITAADLADGANEILIRAADVAGRISSIVKRDVFFDNDSPVVTYENVTELTVVNGETFNIRGTTTDTASTITSVTIAVNGPEDAGYGAEQTVSGSLYSWNYDVDLTPSGVYYSDNPISVRVTATDSALNTTIEELTFSINQEDDMPSLSLSSLSGFTQDSTAMITVDDYILAGVLFDANGVDLDSLVVTVDSVVQNPKIINGADNDTSVSWFVDLSQTVPGTHAYSVVAEDSSANEVAGNYSGMIDSSIPILGSGDKLVGSAEDDDAFDSSSLTVMQNGSDLSGSVTIGSDAIYVPWSYTLPATDDIYYFEISGADATAAAIPVNWSKYGGETVNTMIVKDSGSPVITVTSPAQGAYVNGSVITSGEAYDDLAINTMSITAIQSDNVTTVELTSDPGVSLDQTETTGEFYYDRAAEKYVWNFALERLPDAYENDAITLVYEAEDIVGNTSSRERSITIDTVAPVIDIQYPGNGALVTGEVTIQGVTADEKIDTVEMRRGLTGSWETLPGTYNWNLTFNSVLSAVTDDSTDNGDGTYNYPVEVRATDAAGNVTTVTTYSFNISPDMDKPVLSVTTPADNSTLGGAILFIGTATDNEAVATVYARIDINGDGDYDDAFDLDGANGTNDEFEREGTWYPISDFQNSVWKMQINTNGYLYRSNPQITGSPENFIHIQFMAEDIEGARSIELTRTITLDETFPEIANFGLNGGGSDISGNINLIADITDNEGITNIDISYNGGLNYESVYAGSTLSYTLDLNKDSELAVGSGGLGLVDNSAIVKVRLKVTDTTGYQSFSNLELSVDNISPTGAYTGKVDDIGTAGGTGPEDIVTISGTAKDTGVVSSFDRVEVYIAQEGDIIAPLTGLVSATTSFDFGDGNGPVIYPSNASDFIVIDDTLEQGLIDNDGDGFIEDISYASGETSWGTWFDTSNINTDNAVEVHYVIYDKAGNASHYVEIMLIVGSDLDSDGTVEPSEQIAYPQAFQARRGLLYFELFGGSKTGFNIEVDDNLGNAVTTTTAPDTQVTINTSDVLDYPEGEAIFTIRVYEGADLKLTKNLSVDIKGADVNPPILTMSPLTQSSVVDGHLEQGDSGNGADFDISGTVRFDGTVTDDTMVQDIVLNIEGEAPVIVAEWDTGLFIAKNGAVINNQILDWKEGHSVSFSYEWDSSTITNVANENIDITFTTRDYSNPDVTDVTGYDIVPYISSIERTGFNTNRSKLGFYPLRRGETGVKISGYNLRSGGTNDSVLIGLISTTNSSASGVITSDVPANAKSGELTVTVNNVPAINNNNSNASSYNRENNPYIEGTELWTDDRYIHVWQSNDSQAGSNRGYFTGSNDPIHPAMTIDDSGLLYASWSNYALSDVLMNTNDSDTTTQIFSSYDPAEHTDISFGNDISVVYNANTYGNASWSAAGAGGVELWSNANDRTFAMEELYHNQMLMQFINQRSVTVGDVAHITYYDTQSDSLKYDRKDLTSASQAEILTWINIDGGSDDDDVEEIGESSMVTSSGGWKRISAIYVSVNDSVNVGDDLFLLDNGELYVSPISGDVTQINENVNDWVNDTDVMEVTSTVATSRVVSGTRSANAGEYSTIDVTPTTNYPVIAYYDVSNQKLKLAYSSSTSPATADWTVQDVTVAGSYTGKYVSMRIDSSGYIHLAYYKTSTGDLCYIQSTNNPTDGNTAYTFGAEEALDSMGSVGMWADITLNGTTPVISYLDASRVNTFDGLKIATIETGFDTNYDGTVDAADIIWETQNLPLAYEVDSKRTSIEYDSGSNFWDKAIGYASSDYFRITYYVPE